MARDKLKVIAIKKIFRNEKQPRIEFNEDSLFELSQSIKENGIIQPIVVRPYQSGYQIVAGERRFRAAQLANMTEIPCIVKSLDQLQVDTMAIIENVQRENLSPYEEAKAYQTLLEKYNYTQKNIADVVGKKQSTIANKLRLLNLSQPVIEALSSKSISERHGRALLGLDEQKQIEILGNIKKNSLTVKETEKLVNKKPKEKKGTTVAPKKAISKNIRIATNTIDQAIGMIEKTGVEITKSVADLEDEYIITLTIKK